MPKKSAPSLNLKAFLKDMIDRNGIATVKNIEQILKRIDKLESRIAAIKIAPAGKVRVAARGGRSTISAPVLDVITKSARGIDLKTIQKKTGLDSVRIRNAIFILLKAGKIRRKSRGVYEAVKGYADRPAKAAKPSAKNKPKSRKKKQARKKSKPVANAATNPATPKEETRHDQGGTD